MKIIFVQNFYGFNFGIMYLSSILKQNGHKTDVFIGGLHKNIIKEICEAQPDIIGFTCLTGDHRWTETVAVEIKKKIKAPIIIGGPHPTYFPDMILSDGIDMICRGDGETALLEMINKIQNNEDTTKVAGFWVKKNGVIYKNNPAPLIHNLDILPFPDHDIYSKYPFFYRNSEEEIEMPVCISRGCPFNCTFCYNSAKKSLYSGQQTVRMRSVDNIIEEMKILLKQHRKIKLFIFNDDNLGINANWFNEFCEKYSKFCSIFFLGSIRADFISEERVKLLKKAHCRCLSIGVETGNDDLRKNVLKKFITNDCYVEAARLIKKYDIKLRTSNMIFLPGETIDMAFQTLELNKKMQVDAPWAYTLQPYPGTEIYNYCVEHGFLSKNFSFDDIDPLGLLESPLIPQLKDGQKLKVLQRLFYYGVRVPGCNHLLRLLVLIPNNFIFEGLHRLSILFNYASYHRMSFFKACIAAWQGASVSGRKK